MFLIFYFLFFIFVSIFSKKYLENSKLKIPNYQYSIDIIMRITTFDIGVRNFCFAVIDYDPDTDQWDLIHWALIDLYTGKTYDETHVQCEWTLKNGKQCSSVNTQCLSSDVYTPTKNILMRQRKDALAKMCNEATEGTKAEMSESIMAEYSCNFQDIVLSKRHQEAQEAQDPLQEDQEDQDLRDPLQTIHLCSRHWPKTAYKEWSDVSGTKRCPPESRLIYNLVMALDRHRPYFEGCRQFRVELQPARRMIVFAAVTKGWLHSRFVVEKGLCYNDVAIHNMHAIKKLCMYDGPALTCTKKGAHERNKWFGIKHAEWLIGTHHCHSKALLEQFRHHKKKDDLADVLLMGVYTARIEIFKKQREIPFEDSRKDKRGNTYKVTFASRGRGRRRRFGR